MSEGEPSHLPKEFQRPNNYKEAKEYLNKLVENFNFELNEFRRMWVDEFDVENATRQIVRQMWYNIKKVGDELGHAYTKRIGKQKENRDVGTSDEVHMRASRTTTHTETVSPQNRTDNITGASSSAHSELKSFFIEVIGDWNKEPCVRYHDSNHVKRHPPVPQPLAKQKNKSDQIRRRMLKARFTARNSHTDMEEKGYTGPPRYQWTRRYDTPPPRFAELNEDQDEPVKEDCSNTRNKRQRGEGVEDVERNFDKDAEEINYDDEDVDDDDESDDEGKYEIPEVEDEGLHQISNAKRSREDGNGDELGEEKEESSLPKFKRPRIN